MFSPIAGKYGPEKLQMQTLFFKCQPYKMVKHTQTSDRNGIRTHNRLVRKRTLNHLAKLAKRLSCVVSTYLYGAFDCMLLSCHVRDSE